MITNINNSVTDTHTTYLRTMTRRAIDACERLLAAAGREECLMVKFSDLERRIIRMTPLELAEAEDGDVILQRRCLDTLLAGVSLANAAEDNDLPAFAQASWTLIHSMSLSHLAVWDVTHDCFHRRAERAAASAAQVQESQGAAATATILFKISKMCMLAREGMAPGDVGGFVADLHAAVASLEHNRQATAENLARLGIKASLEDMIISVLTLLSTPCIFGAAGRAQRVALQAARR